MFNHLTNNELAQQQIMLDTQLRMISSEIVRRLNTAMPPLQSVGIFEEKSIPTGNVWLRGPTAAVKKPAPPAPVSPQHHHSSEEVDEIDEGDEGDWSRACTAKKECNCRYYYCQGDYGEVPALNLRGLYLIGLDTESNYENVRAEIIGVLEKGGPKSRSKHINIPEGKPYGYLIFETHSKAVAAQILLRKAGYFVNFQKRRE